MAKNRASAVHDRSHLRKAEGEHKNFYRTVVGPPIGEFEKPHPDLHGADLARRGIRYEDVKLKTRRFIPAPRVSNQDMHK